MSAYKVKWKGKISGPFDESQIRDMLQSGKIGLMHQIEISPDNWVFLKDCQLTPNQNLPSDDVSIDDVLENSQYISYPKEEFSLPFSPSEESRVEEQKTSGKDISDVENGTAFSYMLYALCGASFLSPFILLAALALSAALFSQGKRKTAAATAVLASVMALGGWLFFKFVYPTISL